MREIAVLPEQRGKKISHKLWKELIDKVNPDVIVGETQNALSALTRSHSLPNFLTFWGNTLIGKSTKIDGEILRTASHAYVSTFFPNEASKFANGILPYTLYSTMATDENRGIDFQTDQVLERIMQRQKLHKQPHIGLLIGLKKELIK